MKTRKIKIKEKYSRKNIGGTSIPTAQATVVSLDNNIPIAEAMIPPVIGNDVLNKNNTRNAIRGDARNMNNESSNEQGKFNSTLSKELNDIRKELIKKISEFDDESYEMMKLNIRSAIHNSGSVKYPKKIERERQIEKESIFNEINDFILSLYDVDMTLSGIQIYYVDCLLQTSAGNYVSFTLKSEGAFDQKAFDYLSDKVREYTSSSNEIFNKYLRDMIENVALHRIENKKISTMPRKRSSEVGSAITQLGAQMALTAMSGQGP